MSTIPDGTAASSWIRRARTKDFSESQQQGDSGYAAMSPPRSPGEGWDPYEVWLSRIERPRRLRVSCPVA